MLDQQTIDAREDGYPHFADPLALLDTDRSESELRALYPDAWNYLSSPDAIQVRESYLARHRQPWYSQEKRAPAPFLSTYMGRGRDGASPFRIFFNRSNAIATNGYLLLYPTGALKRHLEQEPDDGARIAAILQDMAGESYRSHGRVYGGGLHKLEPSELASLPAHRLADILGPDAGQQVQHEMVLG